MILTFNPQFIEPIKNGTKIHTIREDKTGRWKRDTKIQFWKGNPRNVKANPHQFATGICTRIKDIRIIFNPLEDVVWYGKFSISTKISLDSIAHSDGFENWNEMRNWFLKQYPGITEFKGKLIFFKLDGCI
jgi:hypothetical protein